MTRTERRPERRQQARRRRRRVGFRGTSPSMSIRSRAWAMVVVIAAAGCNSGDDASVPRTAPSITAAGSTLVALPSVTADDDDQGIGPPQPDELSPADTPRLCLMVSIDEVADATGAQAVLAEEGTFRDVTTCYVRDAAGEKILTVAAGPASGFIEAESAPDALVVGGLGDGAVWTEGELRVLIGTEELTFQLFSSAGVPHADAQSVIEAIATSTLGRYVPPPPDDDPSP